MANKNPFTSEVKTLKSVLTSSSKTANARFKRGDYNLTEEKKIKNLLKKARLTLGMIPRV